MVRVLLAVTHDLLRAALLDYLGGGRFVCQEVESAEALWSQLLQPEWDALILDLCLPQHTKLNTVRTVHDRYPNLPILVISFTADVPGRYWQDAGASGFVSKATLGTELIEAVKVVSQGGKYFSEARP
jgi:two-component system, NarL family, invasion response regulator UvrY